MAASKRTPHRNNVRHLRLRVLLPRQEKEKNVRKPETSVIIYRRNTNEHYLLVCGSELRANRVCECRRECVRVGGSGE